MFLIQRVFKTQNVVWVNFFSTPHADANLAFPISFRKQSKVIQQWFNQLGFYRSLVKDVFPIIQKGDYRCRHFREYFDIHSPFCQFLKQCQVVSGTEVFARAALEMGPNHWTLAQNRIGFEILDFEMRDDNWSSDTNQRVPQRKRVIVAVGGYTPNRMQIGARAGAPQDGNITSAGISVTSPQALSLAISGIEKAEICFGANSSHKEPHTLRCREFVIAFIIKAGRGEVIQEGVQFAWGQIILRSEFLYCAVNFQVKKGALLFHQLAGNLWQRDAKVPANIQKQIKSSAKVIRKICFRLNTVHYCRNCADVSDYIKGELGAAESHPIDLSKFIFVVPFVIQAILIKQGLEAITQIRMILKPHAHQVAQANRFGADRSRVAGVRVAEQHGNADVELISPICKSGVSGKPRESRKGLVNYTLPSCTSAVKRPDVLVKHRRFTKRWMMPIVTFHKNFLGDCCANTAALTYA